MQPTRPQKTRPKTLHPWRKPGALLTVAAMLALLGGWAKAPERANAVIPSFQSTPSPPEGAGPEATKTIVTVHNGSELDEALSQLDDNTVIVLEPGTYELSQRLSITNENVNVTSPPQPPTTTSTTPPPPPPGDPRLVAKTDLAYEGSFTVPYSSGGNEGSLAWGGAGLAYNPANDSLFITGHSWHQRTAEISIPTLATADDPNDLARASFIQTPTDATDGKLGDISQPREEEYGRIGGYLVDGDNLIVTGYHYYDAAGSQIRSHLLTDTNLGASSDMVSISPTVPARWLGGAMALIPEQWRDDFGGDPYLGGLSGVSIAGNSSVGPASATFSPASLTGDDPANLVVGYPLAAPLDNPEAQSDLWNLTSEVRGIVFPNGTASVLYFGTHGTGPYCYGAGDACNDPVRPYQGTHAYPYRYQVWAYDANDLARVSRGEATPESLRPYGVWELDLPYAKGSTELGGAAYDPATGRIFVTQGYADGDRPVVHVFTIDQ